MLIQYRVRPAAEKRHFGLSCPVRLRFRGTVLHAKYADNAAKGMRNIMCGNAIIPFRMMVINGPGMLCERSSCTASSSSRICFTSSLVLKAICEYHATTNKIEYEIKNFSKKEVPSKRDASQAAIKPNVKTAPSISFILATFSFCLNNIVGYSLLDHFNEYSCLRKLIQRQPFHIRPITYHCSRF